MYKLYYIIIISLCVMSSSFAQALDANKIDSKYKNMSTQKNALTMAGTKVPKPNSNDLLSENAAKKNNGFFSFLGNQPPPGFVYFTFALALFGILTTFIGFIVKRIDRIIDRLYSIKQDYWTKTFLVPVCLEPLRDFVLKNSDAISELSIASSNSNTSMKKISYSKFEKEFKDTKNKLICYFTIINTFDSSVYQKITDKIDELEDIITKHCFANSTDIDNNNEYYPFRLSDIAINHLFITLRDILVIISENHNKLFSNKKNIRLFISEFMSPL